MNISTDIGIVLRDIPILRPGAHPATDNTPPIGVVQFGSLGDPRVCVQSTSVEALLALADAAQEAARLLRLQQLAKMRSVA